MHVRLFGIKIEALKVLQWRENAEFCILHSDDRRHSGDGPTVTVLGKDILLGEDDRRHLGDG